VLEQINQIDIAPADALKRLRDEREVLEGRIKAMDEMKGQVADAVYLRVRSDYAHRVQGLIDQSRPLLDQARGQFASLQAILNSLQGALDAANLDRQELDLRHKLGEFDDAAFKSRCDAIEASVSEKKGFHEQASRLRERFVAAVSDERELVGVQPAYTPPPPAVATPAPVSVKPSAPEPPPAREEQRTDEIESPMSGATMVMPAIRPIKAVAPAPAPAASPAPPASSPASMQTMVGGMGMLQSSEATVMMRPARLVPQNPEAGKTTHALSLKTVVLGADGSADIRIGGPGVEPKHAQIVPTQAGYHLTDMDTKHGTRVNAERVRERLLVTEDVIQVGAARFVFRQ